MVDEPKPTKPEPVDLDKVIATADTQVAELSAKLSRSRQIGGQQRSLLDAMDSIFLAIRTDYDALVSNYRTVVQKAKQFRTDLDTLNTRVRERDRTIREKDAELLRTRGDLDKSRVATNNALDEASKLKTDLGVKVSQIEGLQAQLRGKELLSKGANPTEAYVSWVKGKYPPLHITKAPNPFVAHDYKERKLLDATARFILYGRAGINSILDGPTGSGKTTLMEWVAYHGKRPLHFVPPVRDISYDQVIGEYARDGTRMPGPVALFLIYGGFLGFDEVPNLNPRVAVALHGLLQGKPLRFDTHVGPVDLDPEPASHMIVGSGNFAYQKPNFNPATLQRCAFMDLPAISGTELVNILKGSATTVPSFEEYVHRLNDAYPWFFSNGTSGAEGRNLWLPHLRDASQRLDILTKMTHDIRETLLGAGKEVYHQELDLSPATLKRVIALYSPHLDAAGMRDIVSENVINPVAVMYPHSQDEKRELTKRVHVAMERYLSGLGMR